MGSYNEGDVNIRRNIERNIKRNAERYTERIRERNTERNAKRNAERNTERNVERYTERIRERDTKRNTEGNTNRNTNRNINGNADVSEYTNRKNHPEKIISLIYPRRCPVCDRVVEKIGEYICPGCREKIQYVSGATCQKCGKPMESFEEEYCRDCSNGAHYYTKGAALCHYSTIRKSIYRIKYEGRREYLDFFAREIINRLGDQIRIWEPDALIGVPLHAKRQRLRGYNQADLLAKKIGKQMQIPVYSKLVQRCKNTVPQKGLDALQRQNNLKKAFIISENVVKLSTIIIIDDIYTTGSTIDAVTKLLLESGVCQVYYIALAIGE